MNFVGSRSGVTGLLLLVLALLGGCSSIAPPTTATPPTAPSELGSERPSADPSGPVDRRAAQPAALVAERQWLQSWFEGTPVAIELHSGRSISIDVPVEFCFDPGRSRVKPALAAVLDKLAQSMRRLPHSGLALIAAPGAGAASRLGQQRAAQIRRHLRSAGVPANRLGAASTTAAAAVQLRLDLEEP